MAGPPPGFEDTGSGEGRDSTKFIVTIVAIIGPLLILVGYLIGRGIGSAKEMQEVTAQVVKSSVRRVSSTQVGSGGASRKTKYETRVTVGYDFAGTKQTSTFTSAVTFSLHTAAETYAKNYYGPGTTMTVYVHPDEPTVVHSTNYQWVEPLSLGLQGLGLALFCGALFKLAS